MVLETKLGTGIEIEKSMTTSWRLLLIPLFGLPHARLSSQESTPVEGHGEGRTPTAYVDRVELRVVGGDDPIAPIARPLFYYSDSARRISEGGIWAWGDGRPVAMIKSWKNPGGTRTRAFSLTSEELVVAVGPQGKFWKPGSVQVTPTPLRGGPPPERTEAARLRQLKEQARRFSAYEIWDPDNSRFEMRLLIQPVHRYRDEQRGIMDGAIFLLAVDNNPQILLFLEMLKSEVDGCSWQYLLARVSSADLHAALDGKETWAQGRTPGISGKPTDFYWHMVTLPLDGNAP
jgi:hypothetical protein